MNDPLRILIDAHMAGERESGNERYVVNLIRALKRLDPPAEFWVGGAHPEALADVVEESPRWHPVRVSASPGRRLFVELPRLARRHHLSLIHVTYSGPWMCPCPLVATVHDVSYLPHPEWFSWRDRLILRLGVGSTLRHGAFVITISEFSKEEIVRCYRLPAGRIHVTPLAPDPRFRPLPHDSSLEDRLRRRGVRRPYLLAVGNLQPRKNLTRLIEAMVLLRRDGRIPHQLVLAGQAQWKASEARQKVVEAGLDSHVLMTGYVSDEELVALYNQADVFVYPSLYEGFGLPILEAMACGVPVVTSETTALRETAGDAAVLVDPLDVAALAAAIRRVLTEPGLRETLRDKGLRRAAAFTWERTARETWTAYERAAAQRRPQGAGG